MTIGEKIKSQREKLNMPQVELAEKVSISKQTLYKYENDIITNIPSDKIESIAFVLNVTPAYLMGWDENSSLQNNSSKNNKYIKIPVLGTVRAGYPTEAVENIIDYEEISESMARQGEYFALQVKGDSMLPKFSEGDVVIVKKQEDVDNGDIAIMLVNGDEATIKKVQKFENGINLIPSNPVYDVITYTKKEIMSLPVVCLGKVVELRAKF